MQLIHGQLVSRGGRDPNGEFVQFSAIYVALLNYTLLNYKDPALFIGCISIN